MEALKSLKVGDVEIKWLGHAGFMIKVPSGHAGEEPSAASPKKVVYIDPYGLKEGSDSGIEKADLILITHSHYDHCSLPDLQKIVKEGTRVLVTPDCQSKIAKFSVPVKIEVVEPGQEMAFNGLKVTTVPAYNIDKHFHPQEESWVGYVLKANGVVVYHAGDTDIIPEMQKLTGFKQQDKEFIALLPVGGRFTMSAEEAAEAAALIKPTVAVPMHYGTLIGEKSDAEEFKELCKESGIRAEILEKD